jgi:hypothetical protein
LIASKRSSYTVSLAIRHQFRVGTSRYYRSELTRELTEDSRIELAIFENQLFEGATPFLAVTEANPGITVLHLDKGQAATRGYQVALSRRFGDTIRTSVSYVRGTAAGIFSDRVVLEGSDLQSIPSLLERRHHHEIATQVEAYIPSSRTSVNALVKFLPSGNPITSLDTFSDTYEVGSKGINLFVRQVVPVPAQWLTFLGLDFLSEYRIEALLDMVRGGISVQF